MSRGKLLRTTSSVFAIAACLHTAGASAQQTAQGGGLEEIVVTARKVEENLMQVPLAISALTAADVESSGVQNLIDLGKFTPGLFASVSGNGRLDRSSTKLTFRGLSVTSGQVFIDGAPYAGGELPVITDVARVEVLKGPQSVYFGRSTYSGAVNYVSREPADKFQGRLGAEVAQFGSSTVDLSVEGPIAADKLTARLSAHRFHTSGQWKNPLQGDTLGRQETNAAKLYVTAKPNDSLKVLGFLSYAKDDDYAPAEAVLLARVYTGGTTTAPRGGELQCNLGGTGGPYYCGQLKSLSAYYPANPLFISVYDRVDQITRTRLLDNVPVPSAQLGNILIAYPYPFDSHWLDHIGLKREAISAHLKFEYETAGSWMLEATTAFDRTKSASLTDQNYRDVSQLPNLTPQYNPATAAALLIPAFDEHPTQGYTKTVDFSQELRVSSPAQARLRGTVGANFLGIWNPGSGLNGFGLSGTIQNAYSKSGVRTPAVFGALYYDITEKVSLSAEGRYQWDGITSHQLFPLSFDRLTARYGSFSPRLSVDYKYADNSLAYILWSRGYRPGGFNSALVGNVPSVVAQLSAAGGKLAYGQEKLDNYEAGLKSTWLDNRLQTTIAGYVDIWSNGQVSNTIFVNLPNGGISGQGVTVNVGKVNLKGIEFEARYAPTQHFTISGSLNYMHNKIITYFDFATGPKINGQTNVNGHTLPGSPVWTASLSPQYTDHLVGDWDWFARADYTFRDSYFLEITNVAWTAPIQLLNLHLGAQTEALRLEAYVNNATNNMNFPEAAAGSCCTDVIQNNTAANAIRVGVPTKRTFGFKASYKF